MTPYRVLDTRSRIGISTTTPVPASGTVTAPVIGEDAASGVAAVIVNLTATDPSDAGYVAAYASGAPRPSTSTLNFLRGQTIAHRAIVPVGPDGRISLYNGSPRGSVHLVVDVSGFVRAGSPVIEGGVVPLTPARIVDSRRGLGLAGTSGFGPRQSVTIHVAGTGGIPQTGVTAVFLNVTVTDPTAAGALGVGGNAQYPPSTSALNWGRGQTVSNLMVVPLRADGTISFYSFSASGRGQLVVDVGGIVTSGQIRDAGAVKTGLAARVLDTRSALDVTRGAAVAPGGDVEVNPGATFSLWPGALSSALLNVTVTGGQTAGYLTATASGQATGPTSDVNWTAGQTAANLVFVPVGPDGNVRLHNGSAGRVHIVVDLVAWVVSSDQFDAPHSAGQVQRVPGHSTSGVVSTTTQVQGVSCAADGACAIIGSTLRDGTASTFVQRGGSSWDDPVSFPAYGFMQDDTVACAGRALCVAASDGTDATVAVSSSSSGWTFTSAPRPADAAVAPRLLGSACPDPGSCFVVGSLGSAPYIARTDGSRWTLETIGASGYPGTSALRAIACAGPTSCLAVGTTYPDSNRQWRPLAALWDGTSWTASPITEASLANREPSLFSVGVRGSGYTASGVLDYPRGRFTATLSGGQWTTQLVTDASFVGTAVHCPDADTCFAGNQFGLSTVPRGERVALVQGPGAVPGLVTSISCPTATSCLAVAGQQPLGIAQRTVLLRYDGTRWGSALLPVPDDAAEEGLRWNDLLSRPAPYLSCATSFCLAVAPYIDTAGDQALVAATLDPQSS